MQLFLHEQQESHKAAVRRQELADREEVRTYGDKFSTLHYCELCAASTCDTPASHRASANHVARLKETTKCQHCPRRFPKSKISLHVETFHPDKGFFCKRCPAKFATGDNLLEHSYLHLRKMIHNYDELVSINMFSINMA